MVIEKQKVVINGVSLKNSNITVKRMEKLIDKINCGLEQWQLVGVAFPKVAGSIPAPATILCFIFYDVT